MCGIVGYIGKEKALPIIISGLESLEYRGYDSAGIAYSKDNKICIEKESGRISNLKEKLNFEEDTFLGIGHTRWATHGKPNKENSHPHKVGDITIVHNGILENYEELRQELPVYAYQSETDSEVLCHLLFSLYQEEKDMLSVLEKLKEHAIGSYALGILVEGENTLYAIRKDSPLIIGVSEHGNFIASDVPAILEYTNTYYLLDNDEYAEIKEDRVTIYNNGRPVEKELYTFEGGKEAAEKDGYDHFMLKEIYEQPKVIQDTIAPFIKDVDALSEQLKGIEEYDAIDIVGCGSAYHVGMLAKYLFNSYGDIPVLVDIASEYRYVHHVYSQKHLLIVISQSGETADTLAVLKEAKEMGVATLAIVNVVGSSIARLADQVIYIKAGPEIAVATTKAYMCQYMILSLMALHLGIKKNAIDASILEEYHSIAKLLHQELEDTQEIENIAKSIYQKKDVFFLGRKIDYAYSLEASLKLKEVSYLHSEAYAAGELKHGTISLIEEGTPVISIVTDDSIRLKTLSNIKEVKARGAFSILISDEEIKDDAICDVFISVPKVHPLLRGVVVIAKLQLLAYYVAKYNGCDIDKPKNLAKSVTVE